MIIFHDPRCLEYSSPGHPEQPARITDSGAVLKDRHPEWEWRESFAADEIALLRAHSPEHLGRIRNALNDFDADTPAHRDIYQHAVRSAGAAINAARTAMRRERAFSLKRPPGQHAHVAERALEKLLAFKPDVLLVSAGFDAYSGDPITQMTLEREDFATFGGWLRRIDISTAAILEGGYSDELPELVDAFLSAWSGH